MIVIIGAPDEAHSAFMHEKIRRRGERAAYLDTRLFPAHMPLSLTPSQAETGRIRLEGQHIPLADIRTVYWRYHMGIELPPEIQDPFLQNMAHREIESAMGSLLRMLDCLWVNSPEAVAMHAYKIHQLRLLHQAGIRIPDTLVTNDPEAVRAFYEAHHGRVIYKPVRGGAHTETLRAEDLQAERLKELAKSPVQFQECIDGVDVRVYLVGKELFPAEIRSETLDFRADPRAKIVPLALPDAVAADCFKLAELLGLVFSGIDVRRTPEGEYVFLEGNPAPMFIHFEQQAGYPISDRLTDLLIAGR